MVLEEFGISYTQLAWVFNSYQIVYAVLLPVFGQIGDKYGRKRCLVAGLFVFAAGSLLSGFSWNLASLVFFRIVQATGAAAIFPNGVVTATSQFPQEHRGKIMGIFGEPIDAFSMSL